MIGSVIILFGVFATWHANVPEMVAPLLRLSTANAVQREVHRLGPWGPFVFIAIMIAHGVTFIPSEIIAVAGVIAFGPLWGLIYAWIGSMASALLSFYLARVVGLRFVHRYLPCRQRARLDAFIEKDGAVGLFVLRLIPLVSFNALNYASGLTKISVGQYLVATGLGILPAGATIALLYQSAAGSRDAEIALLVLGLVALAAFIWRRRLKRGLDDCAQTNDRVLPPPSEDES